MKKLKLSLILSCTSLTLIHAQDHLVQTPNTAAKAGFQFTTVVNVEATPIKNQAKSGTCWSYSGVSFLESEMAKAGKKPIDLSEMFVVRNEYIDKAKMYVRMHGALDYGEGGELHDVINLYRKYGAVPQSVYTGLHYGTKTNQFDEFSTILKGILKSVIKDENGSLSTAWLPAFTKVVDSYLGPFPKTFTYNGKTYTPKSFAKEVVGLDPDDYIEFTSWKSEPKWKPVLLAVPDNWSYDKAWNIPFEDMTQIVDRALRKGYTVAWATDVSEPGFSRKGIAYIPNEPVITLSKPERVALFNGPKEEAEITAAMRQQAFDNYETTDDHGMQIIGLAKDQNGKAYYMVKNSWGAQRGRQGYWYVTQNYFRYKTTAFLLNKKALPKDMRKRIENYKPYGV
ncbi:MAG: C1 family peptidase [Flavobacteriales bacterium]